MQRSIFGNGRATLALIVGLLPFLAVAQAAAQEVVEKNIQGRIVKLHVPEGDCRLDANHPADAEVLLSLKTALRGVGGNVVVFADCQHLDYWRRGLQKTLDDYGYAFAQPQQPRESDIFDQGVLSAQILQGSKRASAETFDESRQRIVDNLKRRQSAPTPGGVEYMGILDSDANGLYMGNLQDMAIPGGKVKTVAGVWTVLALNRRVVNAYFFRRLKGIETIEGLIRDAKTYAREAHKRNRVEAL